MLAYAANRPDPAGRRSSPNVMLFIVAVHIAAIAALMSAKMDLPGPFKEPPLIIDFLRPPPPPPPPPTGQTKPQPQPRSTEWVSHPRPRTPTPPVPGAPVDTGGQTTGDPGPTAGPVPIPQPPQPLPLPHPSVRSGPTLLTPASALRPPYPESKLLNEEEADLRLRLSIGADGRVTSVDPVGRADPVFLDAARRYIIGHWRYSPATIDSRAVATSLVISLSFRLDG